jgi:hypothetical protein
MFAVAVEHRTAVHECLANPGLSAWEVSELGAHEWLWVEENSDAVLLRMQLPADALRPLQPSELQ